MSDAEQPVQGRPGAVMPDAEQLDAEQPNSEPGGEVPDGEPEVGEPGGGERPRVVPVPLPEGLADVPAGSWLCEALDGIDPEVISGFDTVEVMGAAYRQANRQRAIFLRTLLETGLRGPDTADEVVRITTPGEFAAEEARAALVWSRRRAETAMGLAVDVFTRLPALGEAMLGGWLDEPRARAFTEWTRGLTDQQAGTVCEGLLPVASSLMAGELITRIQREVYAIDPEWAQRRYEDTLATRRIIASRNDDGTANVEGRNLPVDRAAAACDRIDTLARAIKRAGAGKRRIDHIRVDLFLGSTDGTFEGMTDEEIITHVVNHPLVTDPQSDDNTTSGTSGTGDEADGQDTDTSFTNGDEPEPGDDDDDDEPGDGDDEAGPGGPGGMPGGGSGRPDADDFAGPPGGRPDPAAGDEPADTSNRPTGDGDGDGAGTHDTADTRGICHSADPAAVTGAAGAAGRPAPCGWAVRELRVELATLLGRNEHPGEIPGTGYVPAILARQLAAGMGSGQWRYVICSPLGRLLTCGILTTRPRPDGATPRRDARRGGIVEIGVTTGQLDQLATSTDAHGKWAGVITELAHQYAQHRADTDPRSSHGTSVPNGDQGTSVPGGGLDAGSGDATGGDAGPEDAQRRLPGAKLRREIQMRDRQCVHPACRMPATRTDQDHAHDHAAGGLTTAANMSSVCRWHHRLKHDGGWTVSKPEPAITRWDTTLGHTHVSVPPLVMPRLPDPQPRNNDGYDLLPPKTTRACGCYGHCTCGPTMPTDTTNYQIATEPPTKSRTEDEPVPDSNDTPLSFDDVKPPY